MGADLLVYICKGPAVLHDYQRERAVMVARNVILTVREAVGRNDLSEKEMTILRDLTGLPVVDGILESGINSFDPEEVVADLYAAWNEGAFRDTSSRSDPDDEGQQILVAGEMSFGDEPTGGGYRAIKRAASVGLLDFFGIR